MTDYMMNQRLMAMMADGKETWQYDAVVLCAGDFPTHDIPLGVLGDAPYLCCCDGAAVQAVSHGLRPDAIVGDGDSLPDDFKRQYSGIIHLVSEQEYNDMTKATRHCIRRGARRIAYVGATGKREDHTMGNISLLAYYLDSLSVQPVMLTDYGFFVPASGSRTFGSFARQQVSIFNVSSRSISSEGLRWPSYAYSALWQGMLNEAEADTFTLRADGTYIVYRTYEPK